MTALAAQRRRGRARTDDCERPGAERRPDDTPGNTPTLDALVCGAWEGLAARRAVACPVCGGEMVPGYGAHTRPVEGRCRDCGTVLS